MESLPLVVPIRFSGGGLTMQTTTSRMGMTGAFVRCLVGPKQGAEVALEITLPGGAPAVPLRGTVIETVPIGSKGKEAGFWVQFASSDSAIESFLVKKGGLQLARPHAQVIQRTTADEAKRAGRTAGAGLQFIGGDDEFRRRLDACIDNLLK